ncbi:MAG: amidohydrolase family protein, partial [candidate division NC10 bacterium]|nr:amidohydrolase family protein [candidate division NC10 bacterium]
RGALAAGVPLARITLSSDSGAAYPRLDAAGRETGQYMAGPDSLLQTMREVVRGGLTWGQAVAFATRHVADLLGLLRKGRIGAGADADLVLLTGAGGTLPTSEGGRLFLNPTAYRGA